MPKSFTVEYDDNESMPDRIEAMASELGITPQMIIRRALADHVGAYGLKERREGFEPTTLYDLWVEVGILKHHPDKGESDGQAHIPQSGGRA